MSSPRWVVLLDEFKGGRVGGRHENTGPIRYVEPWTAFERTRFPLVRWVAPRTTPPRIHVLRVNARLMTMKSIAQAIAKTNAPCFLVESHLAVRGRLMPWPGWPEQQTGVNIRLRRLRSKGDSDPYESWEIINEC